MYFIIEPHQQETFPGLLRQMFRLRARVFRDSLRWVDTCGPEERDVYDDCLPAYLVHTDADATHLYGAVRLMPTSGPTLLADVFGETLPDAVAFESPFVWEATRLCFDEALIHAHGRDRERMDMLRALIIGQWEFAVASGIETWLANFDDLRLRLFRRAGVEVDVLGTTHSFGAPVHLGLAHVSEASLTDLRRRRGREDRVLSPPPRPCLAAYEPERIDIAA